MITFSRKIKFHIKYFANLCIEYIKIVLWLTFKISFPIKNDFSILSMNYRNIITKNTFFSMIDHRNQILINTQIVLFAKSTHILHIRDRTYEAIYMIAISMDNMFQCNLHIETISISIAKMNPFSFHMLPSSLIMILRQSNRDSCITNCILQSFDHFLMKTIMCNVFDT